MTRPETDIIRHATIHRLAVALACALGLALVLFAPAKAFAQSGPEKAGPNLLLIMTDDQTMRQFRPFVMPRTFRRLVRPGTTFTNAHASPPVCCPARAGLLTGQYAHNHGVLGNNYALLREPENVLSSWLAGAGYRTAIFGKHLNRYEEVAGAEPGPGFHRWFAFHGRPHYWDYEISDQGRVRSFGSQRHHYSTTVLTREAQRFIRGSARRGTPFFAWVSYFAPHEAGGSSYGGCRGHLPKPAERIDRRWFRHEQAPRTPAFNEADVSDKPPRIQAKPPINAAQARRIDQRWRCALGTLREVDRGVERLMRTLGDEGAGPDTVVAFVSDNGFLYGEHRRRKGKRDFYEATTHVPLVFRVPARWRGGGEPVPRTPALVSNVDLAPTLLEYAGAEPCISVEQCRRMDGRSLAPLLRGGPQALLRQRTIPFALLGPCGYDAIRGPGFSYTEPVNAQACGGADELYDLSRDRFQLHNLASSERPPHVRLHERARRDLERLADCSGIPGREGPPGEGRSFCE